MAAKINTTFPSTTTSRPKTVKAATKRSAPVPPLGKMLLTQISRSVALLNSTPDNRRDPSFAYSEAIDQFAKAMANACPESAHEALAHSCMMMGDLGELCDASEDMESYKARSAMRRIKLRIFWVSTWIERQHRIRREDYNLDYFHDIGTAYACLFPHQSDEEREAEIRLFAESTYQI
jgi:hypothetical protein